MDYYHHQEESAYLNQPYCFPISECKCNSEKMTKKPIESSCKEPLESFEYSSLLSSKTYSILSYIVGGFVGSKSQMNNNKHNLSYDLSAAIFNLLNPCKYKKDRVSVRRNNENNFYGAPSKIDPGVYEKYIVNRSSQKCEKMKDCLMEVMDFEWISTVPIHEFVNHDNYGMKQNNSSKFTNVMKENPNSRNCENKMMNDRKIPCDSAESFKKEEAEVFSAPKIDCETLTEKLEDQKDSSKIVAQCDFNTERSEDLTDNSINQISTMFCDNIENSNKVEMTVSDLPMCQSSIKLHSVNFLATQRFRQQSECSVESTDSESFIVFYDVLDQEEDDKKEEECLNVSKDDFDSEDDCEEEEEEDSNCSEYDIYAVDTEIAEANDRWTRNYQNVDPYDDSQRKVRFDDNVKVNKIVAWEYAYRAARLGPWEQMVRDRVRFRERILRLSSTLSPVLTKEHRDKIYNKLYS